MLRQRVITAVLLLAVLLPVLFADRSQPFAWLTLLLVAAAAWEWARLNGASAAVPAVASGGLLAAAGAATLVAWWSAGHAAVLWQAAGVLWQVAALAWTVGGALALRRGPAGWTALPPSVRWGLGLALLWLAWLAMVQSRAIGIHYLLSVMCIVWAADIAAYFGGRRFGRRKLAPTISPGKSWEGVVSGMLGVALLAVLWLWAEGHWPTDSASVFRLVLQRHGPLVLVFALAWLTALGVMGDLFESLVKRAAGVKDSSQLLPGHGGVLDRVDALLPVLPAALALISL
jgi:phosphatidate cytidylyltransferase